MIPALRHLFRRPPPAAAFAPPAPGGVLSVIGDVHGCADLLADLLARLPGQIVLVGDLVDRGPQVPAVLDLVMSRPDVICLRGNHEEMLLGFLEDPQRRGPAWLHHGGLQTLAGYGVRGGTRAADLPRLRDALVHAMGDTAIAWLRRRPLFHTAGTVAVTHAGADPARPVPEQTRSLLWGHPNCGKVPRRDGMWIVQGHVIVPDPETLNGVIRIDTGAYAGGPLTAAVLGDGPVRYETAI